jgi:hypothetical protein
MHNRIVTLFDLDELLGAATVRPRIAGRKPGVKPASPAGAKPGSNKVKAQAFDYGAPITLQHGDAHARSVSRPIPPEKIRSHGLSDFVGAFEDADTAKADEPEETEEDELAGLGIGQKDSALLNEREEEEETESEDSTAQSYRAPPQRRRPVPFSPGHAEQVAAFEREIQELAAKRPPENPPAGTPVQDTSSPDESNQPRPPQTGGHDVFDHMAQGMEFVNEFRLPPVEVNRLFREFDRQIDTEAQRARVRAQDVGTAPMTPPVIVVPAPSIPDDEVLARDLAYLTDPPMALERAAEVLAEQLGTGQLLHFTPEETELDDEETLAVLAFFWPDVDLSTLGQITDQDRSFAQALLIEAADASHSMGIVEAIYRHFFMKVPTSFKSIGKALLKVAKKAVTEKWFKRVKTVAEAEKVQIYESVRVTLQRNFRTVFTLRRTTGELTGY